MAGQWTDILRFDREAETSSKRLAIIVAIGAIALLLTMWMFSGEESVPDAPPPSAPPPAVAPPTAAPAPVAEQTPVASASQITLHGVSGMGENGGAIVSVGGTTQRLVRVGRDIIPGVPLIAVAANHIMVRERGQDVRIAFPDSPVATTVATSPPAAANNAPVTADDEALRREALIYQSSLRSWRQDGRHRGFEIREGAVPPDFAAAGLRAGDVVLRVGGSYLETAHEVADIPRRLRADGRIRIQFIRDGAERTAFFERR